jgi:dethiobiotin synthetase
MVIPVRFRAPQAPSIAAFLENKGVRIEKIIQSFYILKQKHKNLLIEGLGGTVVPLSQKVWLPDFIKKSGLPVLVVARSTLGTINHTCLTVSFLKRAGIRVAGIVFNRTGDPEDAVFKKVKEAIMRFTGVSVLGHLKNFNMARVRPPRIIRSAQKTLKVPEILNHFTR